MANYKGYMGRAPEGVTGTDQYGYIYCIRLPFVSSTSTMMDFMQQEVVKVGHSISNPAGRLHEIMDVFNQLGIKENLLQNIDEADTPETTIQKAKLHQHGRVIFIMKVAGTKQEIEKAEEKIREVLEPSPLGDNFISTFKNHLNEEKKAALEKHTGMTEWILADSRIIAHLQMKFCFDQLYHYGHPTAQEQVTGQRRIPNGQEFCRQLIARCVEYIESNYRGQFGILPTITISFLPTNFCSDPIVNNMQQIKAYEQKLLSISSIVPYIIKSNWLDSQST